MPETTPEEPTARVRVDPRQVLTIAGRPGFVVGHLVVIALAVATIWLGRWQWHVAHVRHGDVQNYAYAFQWWIFCAFGILMWLRILRDRAAREVETTGAVPTAAERYAVRAGQDAQAPVGYRAYVMPSADQIDAADPTDALRTRYNAELGARREADR